MKKLLLLLCSIGANAAFADTVPVSCSVLGDNKNDPDVVNVEIDKLTGKLFSRTVSADNYYVRFLSFTGNYDEYLHKCFKEDISTQKMLGLKFGNEGLTKYIPVNEKYHTSFDLLKDNPTLAAFAEIKAFGDLVESEDIRPISKNERLTVKIIPYRKTLSAVYAPAPDHTDFSEALVDVHSQKLRNSKINIFSINVALNSFDIFSDPQSEAVGLFLSRYLHDNNGLLDNLPFSYGLAKNKTDNGVSSVEIAVAKQRSGDSLSLIVDLYLEPTKFINPQNNPNHLMAVLSVPLVLHTKGYKLGDKKQKLFIEVPKTGPVVRFYSGKRTKKLVDAKTNAEFLGLMALGMTNLQLSESSSNSDTFKSVDLIKKPMGSGK